MNVYFKVALDWQHLVSEFELGILTGAQQSELNRKRAFEGALVLAREGSPDIRIEDELEPWVQNLCYDAIPGILAGRSQEIIYFTRPGLIRLEPDGPLVGLSGDLVPAASFPVGELAPALLACGDRFLKWARKFKEADASYLSNLDYIEGFRPPALAALRGAGLAPTDAA